MKFLILKFVFLICLSVNAQESIESIEKNEYVVASPKEGFDEFYESFSKYIYKTYFRNFKSRKYKITIEINEKGKVKVKDINPKDSAFTFEAKRFLERKKNVWIPAKVNDVPIKSTVTLPIVLVY